MTVTPEDRATGPSPAGDGPRADGPPRPSPVPRTPRPESAEKAEAGGPAAPSATAPDEQPAKKVLTIVGAVLAQGTVLTALLFYFGMLHAHYMFAYFGVNYTVLGLTAQDFLIRSADGLFVPLTVVAAVSLTALWLFRAIWPRLPGPARRLLVHAAGPVAGALGLLAILLAGVAFVDPRPFDAFPWLAGSCLAVGVPLAAWAFRSRRRSTSFAAVAEWTACFVLVAVGLFWAAGDYSSAVGTGRAQNIAAGLPQSADVVLFSEKALQSRVAGVVETTCAGSGFRYDGLKLVMQAGDRYVLLPATWTPATGSAVVLPRSDGVRLEFAAPGTAQVGGC